MGKRRKTKGAGRGKKPPFKVLPREGLGARSGAVETCAIRTDETDDGKSIRPTPLALHTPPSGRLPTLFALRLAVVSPRLLRIPKSDRGVPFQPEGRPTQELH